MFLLVFSSSPLAQMTGFLMASEWIVCDPVHVQWLTGLPGLRKAMGQECSCDRQKTVRTIWRGVLMMVQSSKWIQNISLDVCPCGLLVLLCVCNQKDDNVNRLRPFNV